MPFTVDTDLGRAAAPWIRAHGADITIRRGTVPPKPSEIEAEGPMWQCVGNRVLIVFSRGVRFLVEGGESIRYTVPGDIAPFSVGHHVAGAGPATRSPAFACQRHRSW